MCDSVITHLIKIIMDYQKLLPILQQEDGSWIDARTLYKELDVGKVFGAWIVARIEKYDFIEDEDYKVTVSKIGKRSNVIQKDYSLTLDMAKELSMVENNEIGRVSRKYFIAIDKAFKARRSWKLQFIAIIKDVI